ncbi:MAG: Ig-like domain-containing protein, partial [Anaerolineae bacterium]
VVVAANCLNGFFTGRRTQVSVAEGFQRLRDKGAIAVWAPTGLGYPSGHRTLMREFYDAIFQDDQYSLGAATTAAKIATYAQSSFWSEMIETYVLFGDPATQLGIPTNYPYVKSTIPADGATDAPFDQDIQIVFSKPMSTTSVMLGGPGTLGLPFAPTWSVENTVLNYAHPDFGYSQTLTFTISGEDLSKNPLGDGLVPTTWSFTITDDDVPPDGTIGVEGGALTDVPVTAAVIITFTEPMRASSVVYSIAPFVAGWLSWDGSGQIATYRHYYTDFLEGETYTFTVTAAKDVAGNSLADPLEVTFTAQEIRMVYLPVVLRND